MKLARHFYYRTKVEKKEVFLYDACNRVAQRQGQVKGGFFMILTEHFEVKMAKKYTKILYLYAACNQTFVFLGLLSDRRDGVAHIHKNGTILFQHYFQIPMDTMGMLDQTEVIFTETRRNRIAILNLQTHEFSYFSHQFMNEESDQSDVYTFSQTKYMCIEEKGKYNDNRYKLTYFQYPLKMAEVKDKKVTKTLAVYQAKDAEWTYQHMTKKANNYSMMCWYKPRHDDSFQFKTYAIVDGKGLFKSYKFQHPISVQPNVNKMETVVLNAWELVDKKFLFICLTNKTESKKAGGTVINSNYIVDTSKALIWQANFTFGPYQDYLIDYYNLGLHSMFRTYLIEDGIILKTPTYYIDNQTETIIAEEQWYCSHQYKYELPGYESNVICEGVYSGCYKDTFEVNLKRIYKPTDLYLHLILNSGVDFTNELIEDILCVLGIPLA